MDSGILRERGIGARHKITITIACRALVFLLILISAATALADGKFFIREELPPPGLPYQRALILFDGEREVLVLQSRYEFMDEQSVADFGWVVPVPAKPELDSMDALEAGDIFYGLDKLSAPDVVAVLTPRNTLCILVVAVVLISWWNLRARRPRHRLVVVLSLTLLLLLGFLLFTMMIASGGTGGESVELLESATVGIYDVKVVKARNAGDLITWLREGGFSFNPTDVEVFESYMARGWCFVTARISPAAAEGPRSDFPGGLPDPLILDFPAEEAVYPLALTGTMGEETEVLLYVMAPHRVAAGERLKTRAAVETKGEREKDILHKWTISPEWLPDRVNGLLSVLPWLTKLKGRLSPEEMREDLVLEYAEEDGPYREHVWRWAR